MVGGTASHVGKSWLATAICSWLRSRGVRVAPFKAQNMSNNSYPCLGGGEIGRAQVAQAEACGLAPSPDMNPILLKPNSDTGSQVIVQGKVWANLSARDYYQHHSYLLAKVEESFARLAAKHEFIVVEGAGSIAELNFRQTDLVNLGFAKRLDMPVLLVADIDRGGVFASVYGTLALLTDDERRLVRSFAINRFRGDPSLFTDGRTILEDKTQKPCLGVFPYLHDVELDQEDGVVLDGWKQKSSGNKDVAILCFPRISNLTDFRLLVDAAWISRPVDNAFKTIILPGTKNTIADFKWLRQQGLDLWIRDQHAAGAQIVGVCGGYQMLGSTIEDPHQIESNSTSIEGLRLLPVKTVLLEQKVTRTVTASTRSGAYFTAYEIHMGQTIREDSADRLNECFAFIDGRTEGVQANNCIGTYLHGALENSQVLYEYLGLSVDEPSTKDEVYSKLADWFEASADTRLFEKLYL